MAIIGVAGTVIGAGASAYGAYANSQGAKGAGSVAGLNVGQKPKAAEYKPIDFSDEQKKTIAGNFDALHAGNELVQGTNKLITGEALRRATRMIPDYKQNMALQGANANALLSGNLPYDDVLDIIANRGEAGNIIGTPGGSAPATLRDLGLSRLDAMKTGAGLMSGMVDIAQKINPVERQFLPQSMYLNPTDRIQLGMQQNQLIQQSDQNKYNIEAAATPSQALQAQVALGQLASGGGGAGGIGGYASALQGLLGGIGKFASSSSSSVPSGIYEGSFAQNPNPLVTNQIYRPTTSIGV